MIKRIWIMGLEIRQAVEDLLEGEDEDFDRDDKVPGSAPSHDGRLPGSHILEDILASWHFEWIRVMVVSVVGLSRIYPLWFIVCPIEQGCVSQRLTRHSCPVVS
ncbi:multiple C2 and transmembrane domain-containing protein 1 isoform X1 [Tachysurus ichikawai]